MARARPPVGQPPPVMHHLPMGDMDRELQRLRGPFLGQGVIPREGVPQSARANRAAQPGKHHDEPVVIDEDFAIAGELLRFNTMFGEDHQLPGAQVPAGYMRGPNRKAQAGQEKGQNGNANEPVEIKQNIVHRLHSARQKHDQARQQAPDFKEKLHNHDNYKKQGIRNGSLMKFAQGSPGSSEKGFKPLGPGHVGQETKQRDREDSSQIIGIFERNVKAPFAPVLGQNEIAKFPGDGINATHGAQSRGLRLSRDLSRLGEDIGRPQLPLRFDAAKPDTRPPELFRSLEPLPQPAQPEVPRRYSRFEMLTRRLSGIADMNSRPQLIENPADGNVSLSDILTGRRSARAGRVENGKSQPLSMEPETVRQNLKEHMGRRRAAKAEGMENKAIPDIAEIIAKKRAESADGAPPRPPNFAEIYASARAARMITRPEARRPVEVRNRPDPNIKDREVSLVDLADGARNVGVKKEEGDED